MSVIHINKDNFEEEIIESDTPVIIDFYANWCGPCLVMGPIFEQVSKSYEGKVKFVKANVDDNRELAMRFEIQGIPALVIVKNGEEVDRIVGSVSGEMLKSKINEVLS